MHKTLLLFFIIVSTSLAQKYSYDSLLVENRYEINYTDNSFSGNGIQFLLKEAGNTNFFSICEEHNLKELNELSLFLFEKFNKKFGYNYLVLEQGVAISSLFGSKEARGNLAEINKIVKQFPQSPTFATDEELNLIAGAGKISSSVINPIWGVDQDLGALHILTNLYKLAPNQQAKDSIKYFINLARKHEMDRINGDTLFMSMVANPAMFSGLNDLLKPAKGSETEFLIDALQRSVRIYYNNAQSRKGKISRYLSYSEREESMKLRFMEYYNKAKEKDDNEIKAFVKMGHFHLFRGIYKTNVPTFGNFLSEFSISNGSNSFILSSYVYDSPDKWRNISGSLVEASSGADFTIFDLRPLRGLANQNMIADLSDSWKKIIFRVDAILLIKGGKTGSYNAVKSAIQ